MSAPSCKNCGAPLTGPYCAQCGQRDLPLREPFWTVLARGLAAVFSLDSRVGRTLRPFCLQPGRLTVEFNAGRRTAYSSPLRLYLLTSLLLFFVIGVQQRLGNWSEPEEPTQEELAELEVREGGLQLDLGPEEDIRAFLGEDSLLYRGWSRQRARFERLPPDEQVGLFFSSALAQMPTMLLLMLPVAALILRLVLARTGYVYAEHMVFVLHVHAFYCAVLTLPALTQMPALGGVAALAIPIYFVLAFRRAYAQSWRACLLRCALALPLYLAVFAPMLLGLIVLSVLAA